MREGNAIAAHPDTPMNFETSERAAANVQGTRGHG
jgi:hypothetical protein